MLIILRISFLLCLFQIIYSSPLQDNNTCLGVTYSNLCVKLGLKYYLIDGNSQLNWFEAERFCRRQDGFLATIESADELRLISEYLLSQDYDLGDHWFWISGNDLGAEGIFYSLSTGKLLPFTDWTKGQPDNAGGHENCVHLWKKPNGFGMNDANCDKKMHFICDVDIDNPIFDVRRDWIKTEKSPVF